MSTAVPTSFIDELMPRFVRCLDAPRRRRFRLYWRIIRPFSGLIRIALLRGVAREATGRT